MEPEIFILQNVEQVDKLSCHSHDPSVIRLIKRLKKKGLQLNEICDKITYGAGKWELKTTDYVPKEYPGAAKLLQISNISEDGTIIDVENDKYISRELHESWSVSKVQKGDLIIAITGTLGRIAIFNESYEANLNQALGIIRLKKEYQGTKIIPEYILAYLNSKYSMQQFMRLGGFRAGQAGLSLGEIGSVYVVLPDETEQLKMLESTSKKLLQANKHFKEYLRYCLESKNKPLELFRIQLPTEDDRVFVCEFNCNRRLDANYNSPFLNKLNKNISKTKYSKLSVEIEKANNNFQFNQIYTLIDLDDIDENLSQVKSTKEVQILNSEKTVFRKDNLLIAKLGGDKGKVLLIENDQDGYLGSGELVPFKLRAGAQVSLKYIFYMLRCPLLSKQFEYSVSGCSRMRLSKNGIDDLLLPIPNNMTHEQEIIDEVDKLIQLASKELKLSVQKRLESKTEFERILEKFMA